MGATIMQNTSASPLSPAQGLMPPSVQQDTSAEWAQLIASLKHVSSAQRCPTFGLQTQGCDSRSLMTVLTINPELLTQDQPPLDLAHHTVWFAGQLARTAADFTNRLTALPLALAEPNGRSPEQLGDGTRELLAGTHGLKPAALRMAILADQLADQLKAVGARARVAQECLEQVINGLYQRRPEAQEASKLAQVPGATAALIAEIRQRLDSFDQAGLQAESATVAANLNQAFRKMAESWRQVAEAIDGVLAKSASAELGNLNYLRGPLAIDQAAADWGSLAHATRFFFNKMILTR